MVTSGLLVTIDVMPGREAEVERFLEQGLALVQEEPETTAWFALRLGSSTYGIFDAFPSDAARQAHLAGRVAAALRENISTHYAELTIKNVDIIAAKLP